MIYNDFPAASIGITVGDFCLPRLYPAPLFHQEAVNRAVIWRLGLRG